MQQAMDNPSLKVQCGSKSTTDLCVSGSIVNYEIESVL